MIHHIEHIILCSSSGGQWVDCICTQLWEKGLPPHTRSLNKLDMWGSGPPVGNKCTASSFFFDKNAFIYQKDQSMCHSLKFEANSKEGRSWHSIYCIAKTVRWIFFSFLKQTMRVGKCCVLCSELCMQLQQGKLSMFVLWMNMNTFSRKHIASICSRKQECNSNVSSETSHTSERSITVMKKKTARSRARSANVKYGTYFMSVREHWRKTKIWVILLSLGFSCPLGISGG